MTLAAVAAPPPGNNQPAGIPNPFEGTVEVVSATSVSVKGLPLKRYQRRELRDPNASADGEVKVRFVITPTTTIQRDGKKIAATDIKHDEPIRVAFTLKEGTLNHHATEIEVGEKLNEPAADDKGGHKKKQKNQQ